MSYGADLNHIITVTFLILFSFVNIHALTLGVCNFSGEVVDIRLTDSDRVAAEISNISHTEFISSYPLPGDGQYVLHFRTLQSEWFTVQSDDGSPLMLDTTAVYSSDTSFILLFGYNGIPVLHQIKKSQHTEPVVYVFNETGRTIDYVKITDDWEYGRKGAFIQGIEPGNYHGPLSVTEGKWRLMWNFTDDPRSERFYLYPEDNADFDVPQIINFSTRTIHFIFFYTADDMDYAYVHKFGSKP